MHITLRLIVQVSYNKHHTIFLHNLSASEKAT